MTSNATTSKATTSDAVPSAGGDHWTPDLQKLCRGRVEWLDRRRTVSSGAGPA